jgi:hypothetical protein
VLDFSHNDLCDINDFVRQTFEVARLPFPGVKPDIVCVVVVLHIDANKPGPFLSLRYNWLQMCDLVYRLVDTQELSKAAFCD